MNAPRFHWASVFIVAGFALYFWLFPPHQLLDWHAFLLWTAITAAPLITVLLLVWPQIAGAWGPPYIIFAVMLYTTAFSAALLYAINIGMDHSAEINHPQFVSHKYQTRGKGVHYYVTVNNWQENPPSIEISVDSGFYERARMGQKMTVITRPGALGFDYVKGYR